MCSSGCLRIKEGPPTQIGPGSFLILFRGFSFRASAYLDDPLFREPNLEDQKRCSRTLIRQRLETRPSGNAFRSEWSCSPGTAFLFEHPVLGFLCLFR